MCLNYKMASFLVNLNVLSSNGMHVLYLSMDLNKKFTLKKGMCNASPSEYVDIQEYRVTHYIYCKNYICYPRSTSDCTTFISIIHYNDLLGNSEEN